MGHRILSQALSLPRDCVLKLNPTEFEVKNQLKSLPDTTGKTKN